MRTADPPRLRSPLTRRYTGAERRGRIINEKVAEERLSERSVALLRAQEQVDSALSCRCARRRITPGAVEGSFEGRRNTFGRDG